MPFLRINEAQLGLLEHFLTKLGDGAGTFRYFAKRPAAIVLTHLYAGLLLDNDEPVAYGHLEKDGETLWLGIAVAQQQRGRGIGRQLLSHLLTVAKELNEPMVCLTVDKTNQSAIKLYEKQGFVCIEEGPHYYKYSYVFE